MMEMPDETTHAVAGRHGDTDAAPQLRAHARAARELVTFRLGMEEYGIDILHVQEIRSWEQPTRIVDAPGYLKGVINLRGVIVPIVDMRLKFALDSAEYNDSTVVIVLNVARRTIGVVVDAVSDVIQLAADEIQPAPEISSLEAGGYITGIGTASGDGQQRMLILLDIERLIASSDIGVPAGTV